MFFELFVFLISLCVLLSCLCFVSELFAFFFRIVCVVVWLVVAIFSADGLGLFQTGFAHNCARNTFEGILRTFDVESDATLLQAGFTSTSITAVQYLGVLDAEFPQLMSKSVRFSILLEV